MGLEHVSKCLAACGQDAGTEGGRRWPCSSRSSYLPRKWPASVIQYVSPLITMTSFLSLSFCCFFHLSPAALHIFLFFWNPTCPPSAIKCVLTIWASSSLISYGAPKSTCIFQLPCTDCYTLEDSLKPSDFWKKMNSKLPHSLVSTSPLNSSLPAFSLVQPCCPPFRSSNTADWYFRSCTSFSTWDLLLQVFAWLCPPRDSISAGVLPCKKRPSWAT